MRPTEVLKPQPQQRDPTYADEAAVHRISDAAANLMGAIIRDVADPDLRQAAIALVKQAQTMAYTAIMA